MIVAKYVDGSLRSVYCLLRSSVGSLPQADSHYQFLAYCGTYERGYTEREQESIEKTERWVALVADGKNQGQR